ncbi:MAG: SCO family protein [Stenotrophobium sp.]
MHRAWRAAVVAGLINGVSALHGCGGEAAWRLKDISHLLPDLQFTMQQAGAGDVTAADFRGKVVLLYFGYTHCPDVCPTTLAKLHAVLQQLGPAADDVRVLFVTADPQRDTLAVLQRYVTAFGPDIVGLRGSEDELKKIARRYRVGYTRQTQDAHGNYLVTHSSGIFIFDRAGKSRLLGNEFTPVPDFVSDLRRLLREKN